MPIPAPRLLAVVTLLALAVPSRAQQPDLYQGMHYRCIGPSRGGRVTAVAGVPSQPNTFYMGATGGGVWRTTDFGESWHNVSDGYFATGSIGAIRVARSDPEVVWVGTGSDGLRSNVITGRGIYRSGDGGKSWEFKGLRDVGQIGAVEIHPENPDVVFVAAIGQAFGPNVERGVYRTRDGGKSWKKVLYVSETCGFSDLELNPANPDEIYACAWHGERKPWTIISGGREGGIYKSSDGGETWHRLGGGLPTGLIGKSDLAVSFSDPQRVYALIEAEPGGGVYRSDDRGETWRLVSDQSGLLDRPFYYCNIDADPTDADVVYVCSTGFYRSSDGGKTWRRRRTPHGDNHDLWINPNDPKLMVQSNDGGANVSRDGGETWSTQYNQPTAELYTVAVDDRYPYWVYSGQQDASTVRVSSDGSGASVDRDGRPTWESVGGCETGPVIPKPGDPDIVYAVCKGRFGVYNARTGQEQQYYVGAANMYGHNPRDLVYRFQRVSPIAVSPFDPDTVYHGSQYVHRTRDGGITWETLSPDLTACEPDKQVVSGTPITRDVTGEEFYSTLYSIRESPLQRGVIWAGSNDGPIHVSRDDGASWQNVTPADLPPGGRVDSLDPSPHRAGTCYAAVLRYQLGDWRPFAYRTDDFGQSWKLLTTGDNGIPADTPVHVVREDPVRPGLLYCGTEFGLYVSYDDGGHWQSLQLNLPVTPVSDLLVFRDDLVVATMGRSFWILDDVSRLRGLDTAFDTDAVHLLPPGTAYRVRSGRRGRLASVRAGATIDYFLPAATEDLKLEVLDGHGAVVASFEAGAERGGPGSRRPGVRGERPARGRRGGRNRPQRPPAGQPQGEQEEEEQEAAPPRRGAGRRGGFGRRGGTPRPTAHAGMNRFSWDLRQPSSGGRRGGFGFGRGSLVVPGSYTVRLTAGATVRERPLKVTLDPRVAAEGVTDSDIVAQQELLDRIAKVRDRANQLARDVRAARRALESRLAGEGDDAAAAKRQDRRLAAVLDRLVTSRGRYPQPMLLSQLSYLSGMLSRADQRPGRDAYQRLEALSAELEACTAELAAVRGGGDGGR